MDLIIIGNAAVGKTALLVCFVDGTYEDEGHKATIGIDFKTKKIENGPKVTIWDTAGHERFSSMN